MTWEAIHTYDAGKLKKGVWSPLGNLKNNPRQGSPSKMVLEGLMKIVNDIASSKNDFQTFLHGS